MRSVCVACVQGEADVAAWVAKRVDMLLQQTARLGLRSRAACVSYLGASFRTPLQLSETKSDYTVSHASEQGSLVDQLKPFLISWYPLLVKVECHPKLHHSAHGTACFVEPIVICGKLSVLSGEGLLPFLTMSHWALHCKAVHIACCGHLSVCLICVQRPRRMLQIRGVLP